MVGELLSKCASCSMLWVSHPRPPRGRVPLRWAGLALQGPQQAQEEAELVSAGSEARVRSSPSLGLSFCKDTIRVLEAPPLALMVSPINNDHYEQFWSPQW